MSNNDRFDLPVISSDQARIGPVAPVSRYGAIPAALLLLAIVSPAEPISQLHATGYVNDFARVLNYDTASQLEDLCRQIDEKAHAQIAVVTINSLDGADTESYAVELFKRWGIGSKASNRGVLILYAVRDRRSRVEVGYGLEPILPDGKVGGFQREAIPLLRAADYSGAISLVTTRVAEVIAQDAGIQLTNARPRAPTEPNEPGQGLSPGVIVAIIIVVLLVLFTPLRSLLFWMFLPRIFGGGYGRRGYGNWSGGSGWSGGGFGGGGFGGFGGGSSGGGGASSSW
jgi:uncharacterized protein